MGSSILPDEFWLESPDDEGEGEFSSIRHVYSVSQLNRDIKLILEDNFTPVWIEGEVSTLRTPASGHCYFTLKDDRAQLKAVLFRSQRRSLKFPLREGERVLCSGRISLYEPRGEYQVIVDTLEPQGRGELWRAFNELRERLEREGLFRAENKRKIPFLPRSVVLITSATGAAVRDILQVMRRRFAGVEIIIFPVSVQGDNAAAEIVAAFRRLESNNWRERVDTVILARGGGSYEDLQPFNDENVARAVAACPVPVISAVGHEIDFTIADFAADLRAPTPSAAAELVLADRAGMLQKLHHLARRLRQSGRLRILQERRRLELLNLALDRVVDDFAWRRNRFLELENRFKAASGNRLHLLRRELERHQLRLEHASPDRRCRLARERLAPLRQRLEQGFRQKFKRESERFRALGERLGADSPLAILSRGYAVVEEPSSGRIVTRSRDLAIGDELLLHLHRGRARCRVEEILDEANESFE